MPSLLNEPLSVRRGWALAGALAVVAALRSLVLARLLRAEVVFWEAWLHDFGVAWSWVPFVHTPWFSAFMKAMGLWQDRSGWPAGDLLAHAYALGQVALVLGTYGLAAATTSRRGGLLAAALVVVSPSFLRPFEQYPLAVLLVLFAGAAGITWHRRGGWAWWVLALVGGLASTQFHLSSWFLLLPWWCALMAAPERRRGWAVIALVCLLAFWGSAQRGVFGNGLMDVLDQPLVRDRSIFTPPGLGNIGFEVSNPLLYLPAILWLADRRARPDGWPLSIGLLSFVGVHWTLQGYGLAVDSGADEPHHYFELAEALAVVSAVGWLHARGWPRRWVVALAVSQGLFAFAGWRLLAP